MMTRARVVIEYRTSSGDLLCVLQVQERILLPALKWTHRVYEPSWLRAICVNEQLFPACVCVWLLLEGVTFVFPELLFHKMLLTLLFPPYLGAGLVEIWDWYCKNRFEYWQHRLVETSVALENVDTAVRITRQCHRCERVIVDIYYTGTRGTLLCERCFKQKQAGGTAKIRQAVHPLEAIDERLRGWTDYGAGGRVGQVAVPSGEPAGDAPAASRPWPQADVDQPPSGPP
jgi:hypothetical protein